MTPDVTRDAIQLARGHLLLHYQRHLEEIIDLLTTSAQQRAVSAALLERLHAYVAQVHTPEAQVFGEQYEFEYYRRFVICLKARLQRTLEYMEQPSHAGAAMPVDALYADPGAGQDGRGAARVLLRRGAFGGPGGRCGSRWRGTAECGLRGRRSTR